MRLRSWIQRSHGRTECRSYSMPENRIMGVISTGTDTRHTAETGRGSVSQTVMSAWSRCGR